MFDEETYEAILTRMLDRIPDDMDKREGSIIYDALAPAAIEIAQVYVEMDIMYQLIFGETTDGELLERRVADFGVFKKKATSSIRRGVFTNINDQPMDVPLGSRFSLDDLVFTAVEKIVTGHFKMEAEITGEVGNQVFGSLLPIESIDNLGTAELTEIITPGENEESDESLYEVFKAKISKPATSGNAYQYEQWAKEVNGIDGVRVQPLWDGPNTVRVVVMNSEKQSPAPTVIQQARDYIESLRPIGAVVTVVGAGEKMINISAQLTLRDGADLALAKTTISKNVSNYFKTIAFDQDTVRYTAIGNAILDGEGVLDYSNLKINGVTSNIALSSDEVPILGAVTLTI